MAEARQASVSAQTLLVYSKTLQEFNPEDVKEAIGNLALQVREEGQTAFPELGRIVAEVRRIGSERRSRQATERRDREMEEAKRRWELEREEDILKGIPRGDAQKEMNELIVKAANAPRRTVLEGWSADQLREAADRLEKGEKVEIDQEDDWASRKKRIANYLRESGITREMIDAAREKVQPLVDAELQQQSFRKENGEGGWLWWCNTALRKHYELGF
jgi:hypothetical protein